MAIISKAALAAVAFLFASACASEDDNGGDEAASDETTTTAAGGEATTTTAAAEPETPQAEGEEDEVDDVTVAECTEDEAGMLARIAVTNDSSDRSTYSIDVTFEGEDGSQLGTGFAFIDNLESDQSTQAEAHSLTPSGGQPFTCRIVTVDRTASV